MVGMTINAGCSSLVALYYMFGGKDAELLILVAIFITIFAILFYPFVPESPKLLFEKEKFHECRESLRMIAKWNGVELSDEPF